MTIRRTKIVATLGPATTSPEVLEKLILAGVNVVRLNFSHGNADDHKARAKLVRELAAKHDRYIAIMGDLQGPKIRIGCFKNKRIELKEGDIFRLSVSYPKDAGTQEIVGIDYEDLVNDCDVGDVLLLDDGRVIMKVIERKSDELVCKVEVGGPLSDHKGINRSGGGLTAPALTEKDKRDILLATEMKVDYLAVSFPRSGADMDHARRLAKEAGSHAWLVAKIERAEAVADDEALDGLIHASDAVMVARGDLGVEIGNAELVGIQKKIIQFARRNNKAVIVATQMMESMINSPMPTRAEVLDVANAALDNTDAVMLSAESASGHYPVEAVKAMARICEGAEKNPLSTRSGYRMEREFTRCDETIGISAVFAANHFPGVKVIAALTETGFSPLIMSRLRSALPIYAFTPNAETQTRVALFRGVYTVPFDANSYEPNEINKAVVDELLKRNIVEKGDWIVVTVGDRYHGTGGTNTLKILRAGDKIA